MADDWDLRSNIKNKPGSQGTLFSGGKSQLNPQRRYPRGYTPQRQAEVAQALKDTVITNRVAHPVRLNPPEVQEDGTVRYARYPQAEHRVVDTLARSTMPVSDMTGVTRIHDKPAEGHLATYWPGRAEMAVPMIGRRKVPSTGRTYSDEGEHSLIHEWGHHVSDAKTKEGQATAELISDQHADARGLSIEAAAAHTGKIRPGVEEAVADNYYVKHFRGRGRKGKAPTEGHYEANFEPNTLDQRYPGYTDVRPPKQFSNLSSQFQDTLF